MHVVVKLYWNSPSCPEYPPGFTRRIRIAGFRLSLVLEILSIVYEIIYILKKEEKQQQNPPKQPTTKTKKVFIIALNDFSDPIYSAVVLAQLNCNWRQGKISSCVMSLFCQWIIHSCNCIFCLQEALFIVSASDYKA